jgi:hypothetical protein
MSSWPVSKRAIAGDDILISWVGGHKDNQIYPAGDMATFSCLIFYKEIKNYYL